MKKIIALCIGICLSAAFMSCSNEGAKKAVAETKKMPTAIERGQKLVAVGSCNDCHTAKIMTSQGLMLDTTKVLAGYLATNQLPDYKNFKNTPWLLFYGDLTATVGPWGVSFAKNLTPDVETGIGAWSEEMFIQTIRNRKHMGSGRPILPPMAPIMEYSLAALSDDELKDIFAYLKTLRPVKNKVPEPVLF